MKYLFYDTETNGLPINAALSHTYIDNWPRLLSIAWFIVDDNKNIDEFKYHIIKPSNWEISQESINVHGITNKKANDLGKEIKDVLKQFIIAMDKCDIVVGHNIRFDRRVVAAELYRNFNDKPYDELLYAMRYRDTMHISRSFLKIPYKPNKKGYIRKGYKFPTLAEMYKGMYGDDLDNTHDAAIDIYATIKCFFCLNELGLVESFYNIHRDTSAVTKRKL